MDNTEITELEDKVAKLESEIKQIKARNRKVEGDKAPPNFDRYIYIHFCRSLAYARRHYESFSWRHRPLRRLSFVYAYYLFCQGHLYQKTQINYAPKQRE